MLNDLIRKLAGGATLDTSEMNLAVRSLTDPQLGAEIKADFLLALARKGETVDEIAAFAQALSAMSVPVPFAPTIRGRAVLDVCGTGGDRLGTFNISTTVAILASAAGVVVAKHGNRAITSQAGSADVLEALGVAVDLSPEDAAAALERDGFAFLFAPRFHPAFKHIAPARKLCAERGQRTIFNFLGPLLNPARPTSQLLGVPRPELCEPVARVLQALGVRRGMVACGQAETGDVQTPRFLDELSTLGPNRIAEFYQERALTVSTLASGAFPIQAAALADLVGGDREANARTVERLLRGEERGPKRDIVVLNAAAALWVAERVRSLTEGWELAEQILDDGRGWAKLESLRESGRRESSASPAAK